MLGGAGSASDEQRRGPVSRAATGGRARRRAVGDAPARGGGRGAQRDGRRGVNGRPARRCATAEASSQYVWYPSCRPALC